MALFKSLLDFLGLSNKKPVSVGKTSFNGVVQSERYRADIPL